ncbi:MBL fold metallo-hydrolase [Acetobacterium paludosum]|uniref:MBL fold metallo-hydrolase n=1 Tax=Acetobacterium paludosum TaxID=52693 RepID=A0A923KQT6_9FIRM|nr:MBL fold metallo-hydrolase [Acetobacterium paludosum]MBC3889474.1 MBL fold metallo-hydrolase [Acetobacterium paludosum]
MDVLVIASSSRGNAYRISDGQTSLLLECGVPIREIQKALQFQLHKIDGCLISHEHMDHAKAAKDLIKKGMDVYASLGTLKALDIMSNHRTHHLFAQRASTIGTFNILPFDVQHDAAEPLGFLIESIVTGERLLFFTDTYYLKYTFDRLSTIMGECNYSTEIIKENVNNGSIPEAHKNRVIRSHMSIETLLEFIKANDTSQLKKIYLLHMSDGNSNEDEFKRRVQEVTGVEVVVC